MKQKTFFSRNATKLQNYDRKLSPLSKDSLETKINPRTVKILITNLGSLGIYSVLVTAQVYRREQSNTPSA